MNIRFNPFSNDIKPEIIRHCKNTYQQPLVVKMWSDLFNYATLPFYMGSYQPEPDKTAEEYLKLMAEHQAGQEKLVREAFEAADPAGTKQDDGVSVKA